MYDIAMFVTHVNACTTPSSLPSLMVSLINFDTLLHVFPGDRSSCRSQTADLSLSFLLACFRQLLASAFEAPVALHSTPLNPGHLWRFCSDPLLLDLIGRNRNLSRLG